MERLARKVRSKVSGNRTRYKAAGFDLDLTYITPRIIAMGLPSEGVEGVYRNPIDEVSRFFEMKHPGHFLIINLSERQYDYSKFDYQILEFGFPDHHAPPLDLLPRICESMHGWIKADPRNVVAVHCKAGKGRTGVVIAAYLYWSGEASTADEAMETFGRLRGQQGVTIPSQRRYVDYLMKTVSLGEVALNKLAQPLVLLKVVVNTIPHVEREGMIQREKKGIRPFFDVCKGSRLLWTSDNGGELPFYKPSDGAIFVNDVRVVLWGDVYIKCYHASKSKKSKDTFVFRFAFNTAFVASGMLSLKRSELDGPHKNPGDFDQDFGVDLYFGEYDEEVDENRGYLNTLADVKMTSDDECWKFVDIKKQREEFSSTQNLASAMSELNVDEGEEEGEEDDNDDDNDDNDVPVRAFIRGRAQTAYQHRRATFDDEEEEEGDGEGEGGAGRERGKSKGKGKSKHWKDRMPGVVWGEKRNASAGGDAGSDHGSQNTTTTNGGVGRVPSSTFAFVDSGPSGATGVGVGSYRKPDDRYSHIVTRSHSKSAPVRPNGSRNEAGNGSGYDPSPLGDISTSDFEVGGRISRRNEDSRVEGRHTLKILD